MKGIEKNMTLNCLNYRHLSAFYHGITDSYKKAEFGPCLVGDDQNEMI